MSLILEHNETRERINKNEDDVQRTSFGMLEMEEE